MNKKQLRKELQRIQSVEQELNVRIDNLEKVNNELVESNNELTEQINELVESNNEQAEQINKQAEETKDIKRVQEQQGIDIAALAKAINNLGEKKTVFEDEYAAWEDKYQRLQTIVEDNPDLEGCINLASVKQGMANAMKSMEFIDEKLDKMYKLALEIENFDELNYNSVRRDH